MSGASGGGSRVLNDVCRAIEKLQHRIEEVERHNLSLNENVKNCAQLIKLTQAFAEEQGKESSGTLAKLEQHISAAANTQQLQTEGFERSVGARVDQVQIHLKELVATRIHESHDTDRSLDGFQAEIMKKNSNFEATLTQMTKRHADVLYQKLDQDAKQLVSERVQV